MNKKEMGITIKGLMQHAEICLDSEAYQELDNALNMAFAIASAWDLKEIDKVEEDCKFYRSMARKQICEEMERIEKETAKFSKLQEAYVIL